MNFAVDPRQDLVAIAQVAVGQLANHPVVHDDHALAQAFREQGITLTQVINPDRRVNQQHQRHAALAAAQEQVRCRQAQQAAGARAIRASSRVTVVRIARSINPSTICMQLLMPAPI